jgi:RNA 3'-terminal phosphate cyclase (ATP)
MTTTTTEPRIRIDGAEGEGGGQVLRTALALSLVTGEPFRIDDVRAGRPRPGLQRQHLTAVLAAAEVGGAEVEGAAVGATALTFRPGRVRAGDYRFAVGTAGSATLVVQTVLPALLTAPGPSRLVVEGGTHNPFAPPFDFLQKSYLPLVGRMGPRVTARLERAGFYPAGGGRLVVEVEPVEQLRPVEVLERGAITGRRVRALVANLPASIARRELTCVAEKLNWPGEAFTTEVVEGSPGPGNVLLVEVEAEAVTAVFTGFGMPGVPAEAVAREAVEQVRTYLAAGVPVERHLADQLLVPMALAGGGVFRTTPLSRHARTNVGTVGRFLDVPIRTVDEEGGTVRVEVG